MYTYSVLVYTYSVLIPLMVTTHLSSGPLSIEISLRPLPTRTAAIDYVYKRVFSVFTVCICVYKCVYSEYMCVYVCISVFTVSICVYKCVYSVCICVYICMYKCVYSEYVCIYSVFTVCMCV